jgi:NAD(P) transhydrogenase subunit alpha
LDPKTGQLKLNREDEIIAGSLVCIGGEIVKKL